MPAVLRKSANKRADRGWLLWCYLCSATDEGAYLSHQFTLYSTAVAFSESMNAISMYAEPMNTV